MTTSDIYRKEIVFDRETRDYAMYLDGELLGFERTYHSAEVTLDRTVYELLSAGHFSTATELDGGADDDEMAADRSAVGGLVVVPIATEAPESLREDCLNVITMALGSTHGAQSVVSELRRVKARLEAAAA